MAGGAQEAQVPDKIVIVAPPKKLTHVPIAMIRTMMRMKLRASVYNIAEVKEMPKCGFGFVTWCLFGCG